MAYALTGSPRFLRASYGGSSLDISLSRSALLAASLLLFAANTRHGLAIQPDSTRYMGISPVPYDAPVYHWLLTGGLSLDISLSAAATAIALLTLVANVLLIHGLILRGSGDWRVAAVGAGLATLAPQFVGLHASAMSEAPFLSFLLLSIWCALSYLQSFRRTDLVLSAVLLGVASLTRFTAPPLGAAIAAVILLDRRRALPDRLKDCLLLALVSGGIFFSWVVWSQISSGRSIGRELAFYGNMGAAEWRASLDAFLAWVLPGRFGLTLRLALLLVVLGTAVMQVRREVDHHLDRQSLPEGQAGNRAALTIILGGMFVGYLGFVLLSTTIEANLTFDGRYALPAYIFLVMLLSVQFTRLEETPSLRTFLLAMAVVVGLSHGVRTAAHTLKTARDGGGYNADIWRNSATIAAVRKLPADAVIYANGPDVTALKTGRKTFLSPQTKQYRTDRPEPGNELPAQLARIQLQARTRPVFLVFYDHLDWRFYLASEPELVRLLSLPRPARFDDGRIYQVPDGAATQQAQP